ncbi:hypothetical protein OAA40_00375 [bacterium]|nr:hypothetical protein [bacterium]
MPTNKIIYGPGRIPKASEFAIGEIIINLDDSKVYSKNKQNVVFEVASSIGNPDGFKNVYLSSLFESSSLTGDPLNITQGTTILRGAAEGPATNFDGELAVGSVIKIVSGAFSSFHEITSITNDQSASFTPEYNNGSFDASGSIKIMARNESGSLLITSSLSNRDLIFSGSSGVVINTGSQPQSIEISIDGTSISPQSENIEGTLFILNDTSDQTGINFSPNGNIESGNTISAVASGLGTSADVQFGTLNVGNLTSTGTITFSGLDDVSSEEHVLVFNTSNNEVDYIPTSSLIPVLQNSITTIIDPYGDADSNSSGNQRVGGVDHNISIPAGTTLEKILRDILVDYIDAEINSLQVQNPDGDDIIPESGDYVLEVGDSASDFSILRRIRINGALGTGDDFFDSYTSTLTGNQDSSGNDSNTLPASVTIGGTAPTQFLTFASSTTINRIIPGNVSVQIVGTNNSPSYTKTSTISLPINYAVFCGSSQNGGYAGGESTFPLILADISGSHSTTEIGNHNSRNSSDYGIQTVISYKHGVRTIETPSTTNLPDIGTNSIERGIALKTDSNSGTGNLGSGYFTYICYPKSYGALTKITVDTLFGGNLLGDFVTTGLGKNHDRFGITTEYLLYRSQIAGYCPPGSIITIYT